MEIWSIVGVNGELCHAVLAPANSQRTPAPIKVAYTPRIADLWVRQSHFCVRPLNFTPKKGWVGVTKVINGPPTRSYLSQAMLVHEKEAVCTRFRRWIVLGVSKHGRKSEEKISVDKLDSSLRCASIRSVRFLDEGKATRRTNLQLEMIRKCSFSLLHSFSVIKEIEWHVGCCYFVSFSCSIIRGDEETLEIPV